MRESNSCLQSFIRIIVVLAALRFCRKIIGVKDEFYNRYITKGRLLAPIVKAFEENGDKYNMINSAVIEMFEFIRVVSSFIFDGLGVKICKI